MCIYVEQLTSTLYVLAQYYYVMWFWSPTINEELLYKVKNDKRKNPVLINLFSYINVEKEGYFVKTINFYCIYNWCFSL